ncbi:MAG: UDP-N-acetylmuramoyl-L-alanyl-D-glutamate--2,6-diaminopimelate ligase [Phascolarctobacterium sp.]|nr:UDP-N-acetylmuramoyl-L-alanyl-D-glutamate--2,6-diaminopimelate ligase [Phascolarctobacterium sp.]
MTKNLTAIIDLLEKNLGAVEIIGSDDKVITDVTADSRVVIPGSLFICLKGATVDGHKFLKSAVEKGAVVALVEDVPEEIPAGVTLLKVTDTRNAMEIVTPYFFDYPGKKMRMIGLTGTNGKTTTTNIIRTILRKAGYKVGLIGTINIMIEDQVTVSHNTTPDVVDLQKTLFAMQEAGCEYVVMEVSSHALALKRVAGCEYDCAVLTNITQDHLDFHKTMENYRDAKSLLFEGLACGTKPNKHAVFNMDDASSEIIKARTSVPCLTYGKANTNDIYPLKFVVGAKHMELHLMTPLGEMDLELKITGEFNVYNVMAAVGAMVAENIDKEVIVSVLDGFDGVPGRFQLVEAGQPYTCIVDYAHTPDGLVNVLTTARSITKGKLWSVFGCGGDRDNRKRPIMGSVCLELADNLVVTSDNPRTEDPECIIDEIFTALQEVPAGKKVYRLSDRKEAIEFALANAADDDVILIAGKGHENYQILKDRTIHFDDREVIMNYWRNKNV